MVASLPGVASLRKYTLALPLTSKLADLRAGYVNPYSSAKHSSKFNSYVGSTKTKRKKRHTRCHPTGFALWAIFFALPLTSELDALYGSNVNPYSSAKHSSKFNSYVESAKTKRKKRHTRCLFFFLVDPTGVEPVSENLLI